MKEKKPDTINEYETRSGKANVKVECLNPKLVLEYENFFTKKYEDILFKMRIHNEEIQNLS